MHHGPSLCSVSAIFGWLYSHAMWHAAAQQLATSRLSEEFMDQQIYAMQNSGLCPQSLEFCSQIRTTGFSHHVLLGCCRKPVGTQAQSPGTLPSSLSGRMALSLAGQALRPSVSRKHISSIYQSCKEHEASATDLTVSCLTVHMWLLRSSQHC